MTTTTVTTTSLFLELLSYLQVDRSAGSYCFNTLSVACCLFPIAKEALPESHCGFRPARGMTDSGKVQRTDLYMAFIDLTKAFDSIHRPALWKLLSKIRCPEKYMRTVWLLHDMSTSVLIDGESTKSFEVKTGVKQGCVVDPSRFSSQLCCTWFWRNNLVV